MRLVVEFEVEVPDQYVDVDQLMRALKDEHPSPGSLVADWFGDRARGTVSAVIPGRGRAEMRWYKGKWSLR